MPFQLKFFYCESSDCKTISLTDETGSYNAVTNPTGWDQGNVVANHPSTSDVGTSAEITVVTPDNVTFTLNVSAVLPNVNGTTFDITMDLIGGSSGDVIPDGLYKITYKVIDSSVSPSQTYIAYNEIFPLCNVDCKLQKLLHEVTQEISCDKCTDEKISQLLLADLLFDGICASTRCGDKNAANDGLTAIKGILDGFGCSNC